MFILGFSFGSVSSSNIATLTVVVGIAICGEDL